MTSQEKLEKIKHVLGKYAGNDGIFGPPAEETARQRQFREDLHTVVAMLFEDDSELHAGMSVAEIKARMQTIWEKTKPETWKA